MERRLASEYQNFLGFSASGLPFSDFLLKQIFEKSFPRIKVGFEFRGVPAPIVIPGMSHFMPEVTECWARLGNRAIYTNPNPFDLTTPFDGFTHAAIFKDFWKDKINTLNESRRYAQSVAFRLDLRFKKSLDDLVEFFVRHFSDNNHSRRSGEEQILAHGTEGSEHCTHAGTSLWTIGRVKNAQTFHHWRRWIHWQPSSRQIAGRGK